MRSCAVLTTTAHLVHQAGRHGCSPHSDSLFHVSCLEISSSDVGGQQALQPRPSVEEAHPEHHPQEANWANVNGQQARQPCPSVEEACTEHHPLVVRSSDASGQPRRSVEEEPLDALGQSVIRSVVGVGLFGPHYKPETGFAMTELSHQLTGAYPADTARAKRYARYLQGTRARGSLLPRRSRLSGPTKVVSDGNLAQEEVLPETVGTEINNADLNAEVHSATRFNFLLPLIGVADYKSVIKSREILGGIGISKQTTALAVALAELMDCGRGSRIHPLADESRVSASHAKLGFKLRGATEGTPPHPLLGALLFGMTEKYQLHRTPVELRQLQKLGIEAVKKVEWGQFSGMCAIIRSPIDSAVCKNITRMRAAHQRKPISGGARREE